MHVGSTTTFDPKIGTSASRRAIFAESELAFGLTEGWDVAITSPYSHLRRPPAMETGTRAWAKGYAPETGGVTVRQMLLQPDREKRLVYWGVMVRFGYAPPGSEFSDLFVRNKVWYPRFPGAPGGGDAAIFQPDVADCRLEVRRSAYEDDDKRCPWS